MNVYERTLTVAACVSRVWRAFTEPEDLRAWHGTAIVFEAREGGRVLFRDQGYPEVSGSVRRVVPERLLHWDVSGAGAAIIEEFEPSGTGTTVTVRQQCTTAPAAHERQAYVLGWDESLADMALLVEHGVRYSRHMSPRSRLGAQVETVTAGVRVVSYEARSGREHGGPCADPSNVPHSVAGTNPYEPGIYSPVRLKRRPEVGRTTRRTPGWELVPSG